MVPRRISEARKRFLEALRNPPPPKPNAKLREIVRQFGRFAKLPPKRK